MPVTSEQYQRTALTPSPGPAEPTPGPRTGEPATESDPDRVGVVFVHGIGSQTAAETFLDWSRPIVDLLADWRREHDFEVDPVRRSQFSFNAGALPFLEIEIPAFEGHPRQTWVITEAWWATQVRPPSLGTVTTYLRHGLGRILDGIRAGYEIRESAWTERVEADLKVQRARRPAAAGTAEAEPTLVERTLAGASRWGWIRLLDWFQKSLTILALGPSFLLGTAALAVYSPLRAIPFKPLRDLAVLRQADNFLVQWFGDLPTLLSDPVQSANVRARTIEAIDGLVGQGCGRIVLVAHSGGAIVSFMTLLDPVYRERRVDKLVTIGQGLGVAWHLEDRTRLLDKGNRLAGDIAAERPELLWYDYWASYDPAPGGPLTHPRGLSLPVDSKPITNRMSIIEDHGAYWDNDEGFLIPLVRHLDTASSRPEDEPGSRFFRDSGHRAALIERRRERVGVLALWRWIVVVAAVAPIVLGTLLGGTAGGPAALGRRITAFWGTVPAHELVSAPIAWLAELVRGPAAAGTLGEWLLGASLIALLLAILGAFGLQAWAGWDRRERQIAHASTLQPVDRRSVWALGAALLLLVALVSTLLVRALI